MAIPTMAGTALGTNVSLLEFNSSSSFPPRLSPSHVLTAWYGSMDTSSLLPRRGANGGDLPGWCSRFGAILAKGLAEPQALGSRFTKRWEACWGCASPCGTTWVRRALLCPPCMGPSDIPGAEHPHHRA